MKLMDSYLNLVHPKLVQKGPKIWNCDALQEKVFRYRGKNNWQPQKNQISGVDGYVF